VRRPPVTPAQSGAVSGHAEGCPTSSGRTERPLSCMQDAHVSDGLGNEGRTPDPVQIAGIGESERTERAASTSRFDAAPLGPGGSSRVLIAKLFSDAVQSRWENGADWATNENLAGRYCKNTESVVRRWRNGEKLLPLAALHVLPAPLAEDLATSVLSSRAVTLQRTMGTLRETVARLGKPVRPEDRDEVLRGLVEAQRVIADRIAKLATEGK
jgi:hypothetical protein